MYLLPALALSLYLMVPDAVAETTFQPSILLREAYDDNIYLTADNEKDDFITTVIPRINLGYQGNRLDLSLDYGAAFSFYAKNSRENEVRQSGSLASRLTISRDRFFLKLDDTYVRTQVDQRRSTSGDSSTTSLVNSTDVNTLRVNPYLQLPLTSRTTYNLGYTYENISYWNGVGDDTQNHILATGISSQLSEKIVASLNYSYRFHRPTQSDDYDMQNVSAGLTYQVSPKLSLSGTVGQVYFNYSDPAISDSSSLVWSAKGDYKLTENLSLNGGYAVGFSDSVDQGTYESKSATAGINYSGSIPVTIVFFKTEDIYQDSNREDRSNGVRIGTSLPLGSRMQLKAGGMYTRYKFLPEDERTDRYSALASIEYTLRTTTFSLGYTFNSNDSNIDSNDYRDNIVYIQARLAF